MNLMLVLPPAVVVLHLIIACFHRRGDRAKQLLIAVSLIAIGYPLQLLGVVSGLSDTTLPAFLLQFFLFAPPILSVLSFLIYVPLLNQKITQEEDSASSP